MDEKMELRKAMKKRLKNIQHDIRERKTSAIHERLFQTLQWKEATAIGVTISIGDELDTYNIIRRGWSEEKIMAIPRCNPTDKTMTFRILTSFQELEETFFGLQEPTVTLTKEVQDLDLILVPGLAFTPSGKRLGYGGGYYDRYLITYQGGTLSLAFEEQLVSNISTDIHDMPVQLIITEKGNYE